MLIFAFHSLVISWLSKMLLHIVVCWGGNISKRDINRITGIIKKSTSIIQSNEHSDFCMYYKNAILHKLQAILKEQIHLLHPEFHKHVNARSGRMGISACSSNRYLKSAVHQAI